MIAVKVRRFGTSLGVIVPKAVLARLSAREDTNLLLVEDPRGGYRLSTLDPGFARKLARGEDIIRRYPTALRVMAGR